MAAEIFAAASVTSTIACWNSSVWSWRNMPTVPNAYATSPEALRMGAETERRPGLNSPFSTA